jgi:YggT family protein
MNTAQAFHFLISSILDFYSFILLARFLFQLSKADFYNPISQMVLKATDPLLAPLRKILPQTKLIDAASFLILLIVQIIKYCAATLILFQITPPPIQAVLAGLLGVASITVNFFLFALFIIAIGSWFSQGGYHPFLSLLGQVTEPLVGFFRRFIPPAGGFDFSLMVAATLLFFIKILFGL